VGDFIHIEGVAAQTAGIATAATSALRLPDRPAVAMDLATGGS
jgi:hypothetical protein